MDIGRGPENEAHYGSCVDGCNRYFRRWQHETVYSVEGPEGEVRAAFPAPTSILDEVFRELERQYEQRYRKHDVMALWDKQVALAADPPAEQLNMF